MPSSRSASASPETTTAFGPFTAATESRAPNGSIRSRTHSSDATIDSIPPRPDRLRSMACARSATTRAPSSSASAPETQAAAISPCEWPTTADGSTPYERHSAARDTITAHVTGWSTSTRSSGGAPGAWRSTLSRSQSTNAVSARPHSAIRSANTGAASSSSTAMPTQCEPWPGNTNTTRPSPPAAPGPATTPGASSPRANAPRPATSCSREPPVTTARFSSTARPDASDQPTSTGDSSGSPSTRASSRATCSRRAPAPRPDTTHGTATGAPSALCIGSGSGARSRMTWTFVPLTPNDDTPARRGRPSNSGHSCSSASTLTAPADQSTCVDGSPTWRVRGRLPWRSASTILITPATPAAACVCPMFDFSDPSHSGRSAGRPCPYVAIRACASIGSPSAVPVPCASTAPTSAADTRAFASA